MFSSGNSRLTTDKFVISSTSQKQLSELATIQDLYLLARSPVQRKLAYSWHDICKEMCAVLSSMVYGGDKKLTCAELLHQLSSWVLCGVIAYDMEVLSWDELFYDLMGPGSLQILDVLPKGVTGVINYLNPSEPTRFHFCYGVGTGDGVKILYDPSPSVCHDTWKIRRCLIWRKQ